MLTLLLHALCCLHCTGRLAHLCNQFALTCNLLFTLLTWAGSDVCTLSLLAQAFCCLHCSMQLSPHEDMYLATTALTKVLDRLLTAPC